MASKLFAPHYAKSSQRRCGPDPADLRSAPSETAEIIGTLQPGQGFDLLDITAGWAWGYRSEDRQVAYLAAAALADPD